MTGLSARTRLVAILGHPVAHSLSPEMHNAAFAAAGLEYQFVACDVEPAQVPAAVQGLRGLNFAGACVTMPHKQAVMPHLEELSGRAQRIGAVNTIVHRAGRLLGDNTDGIGFLRSVDADLGATIPGRRCVVLGAGGAARAVLDSLADAGAAQVTIINRTRARAEALKQDCGGALGAACEVIALDDVDVCVDVLAEADLVVNCTSVGMQDDATPVDPEWLNPTGAVYDTIYTHETALVRGALARGIAAVTGEGMLVHQGAAGFEQWTGAAAPVEVMRKALEAALAARR